jgi:hypothetical protein
MNIRIKIFIICIISFLLYIKFKKNSKLSNEIKLLQFNNFKKFFRRKKGKFSNIKVEKDNLDNLDMIYCMCLRDRKEYMQNLFKKLNLKVKYLDSILPSDLDEKNYEDWWDPTIFSFFSKLKNKTKLPVALSFLFCLMDAKLNNYKNIMIFEDDISFVKERTDLENMINEFVKTDLDILYIGNCWTKMSQKFDLNEYKYLVELPNKKTLCKHAMVLKSNTFNIILKNILPLRSASDVVLTEIYKEFNLKIGIPKETFIIQDRKKFKSSQGDKFPLINVYYKLEKFFGDIEKFISL